MVITRIEFETQSIEANIRVRTRSKSDSKRVTVAPDKRRESHQCSSPETKLEQKPMPALRVSFAAPVYVFLSCHRRQSLREALDITSNGRLLVLHWRVW